MKPNDNMAPDWAIYLFLCLVTGYAPESLIRKGPAERGLSGA